MSRGVYTGVPFGSIQTSVYDQMGVAVDGGLYSASDYNLVDSISVGETNGVGVGYGVVASLITGAIVGGINDREVKLPTSSSTAANFGGFVIRTQAGYTDASGNNYVPENRMASVLRADRVGGRIWIKMYDAFTADTNANWVVGTVSGIPTGRIAGAATASNTVALTNVKFRTTGVAGDYALVEIV